MLSKELVAASTVPLVLSVLSKGENYGYALIQRVRELSGGDIEWTEGMLYPVLHWMDNLKKRMANGIRRDQNCGRAPSHSPAVIAVAGLNQPIGRTTSVMRSGCWSGTNCRTTRGKK